MVLISESELPLSSLDMMKKLSLLLVLWSGRSVAKDFSHADEAPQCNDQRKMVQVSSPQKLDKVAKTTRTRSWVFEQQLIEGVDDQLLVAKCKGNSGSAGTNSNWKDCEKEGDKLHFKEKSIEVTSTYQCSSDGEDCEVRVESFTRKHFFGEQRAGAPLLMKHDGSEQVFRSIGDEPLFLVLSLKTGEIAQVPKFQPLVDKGVDPTVKLEKCEGDCDEDTDCKPGLKCFHRQNGYTFVPGCSGLGGKNTDYCFDEGNPDLPDLSIVEGSWKQNLPSGQERLDLCQGDCDMDSECKGEYVCFQRDDETPVPGCSGKGERERDYCSEPVLTDLGDEPVTEEGLGQCQGDCDNDKDCQGDLKCFKRDGLVSVPGCRGSGAIDYDYCVNQ
jgi:hypothetical protein